MKKLGSIATTTTVVIATVIATMVSHVVLTPMAHASAVSSTAATWQWQDLDAYQGVYSRQELEEFMHSVMIQDNAEARAYVERFIVMDDKAMHVVGEDGQEKYRYEFRQDGKERQLPAAFTWNGKDLSGLRVSIDPSNDRWKQLSLGSESFYYPDLTRATALELARLLRAAHAEVQITREERDKAYPLASLVVKMNEFRPHIALATHFNMSAKNAYKGRGDIAMEGQDTANFIVAFTPGAFMKGELHEERRLYVFVHGLLSGKARQSIELGDKIVRELSAALDVPRQELAPGAYDGAVNVLKDQEGNYRAGVAARNLFINQVLAGAVVYGFPLLLDNVREFTRLAKKDFRVDDTVSSDGARLAAKAYYDAIVQFVQQGGLH